MSKLSKHIWKEHRTAQTRRIKAGLEASNHNPTLQDFITALQDSPARAYRIYTVLRKRDFIVLKQTMDALESVLPLEVRLAWKAVEAIHDELGGK